MKRIILALSAASIALAACSTNPYTGERRVSNTGKGVAAGAAIGAAIGALTNTSSGKEARKNALIGAGIGALAGGSVGIYMDRQAEKLRQQLEGTGVRVQRNPDNTITLIMPSNVTFDVDRAEVKPQFYETLRSVSLVFKEYDKTTIDIFGHTDSSGSDAYNQELSQRRANSVASYLISSGGLMPQRFIVTGYGENYPIADNATDYGKAQNRRVEIQVSPFTG